MRGTLARHQPRRRLTWPDEAPRVGIHLGVARGLLRAARRARQIGATALQIFSDNPTAWRRRIEAPGDAPAFVAFCASEGITPVAIHASYLINLAGSAEPFARQSIEGLTYEMQRAPAYGATLVNTHIGSHRGGGRAGGIARLAAAVSTVLGDSPTGVRLVLENSAGGGDTIGGTLEELASILEAVPSTARDQLAFCLDTAHLWGAGYDISTAAGATAVLDRFDELMGLDRLALVHLNDSRSIRGSRGDRHEHIGAGRIGAAGLAAFLRDPRLPGRTALVMETPGVDEGFDATNMRRSWLLYAGAQELPVLPPRAFRTSRASTRTGRGAGSERARRAGRSAAG